MVPKRGNWVSGKASDLPYTLFVAKARNSDLGQPVGSKHLPTEALGTPGHVEKFGGHPDTQ